MIASDRLIESKWEIKFDHFDTKWTMLCLLLWGGGGGVIAPMCSLSVEIWSNTVHYLSFFFKLMYFIHVFGIGYLVKDTITLNDYNFLETLCQKLDPSRLAIKNWKNLAQVLGVPHDVSRKFDFYTHTSPTGDLFECLQILYPNLTVRQLQTKLTALHRNDLVLKLGRFFCCCCFFFQGGKGVRGGGGWGGGGRMGEGGLGRGNLWGGYMGWGWMGEGLGVGVGKEG